ncbi:MAG: phenylacetate--CoA ligase family protein [Candidatus Nanohaloarchaea archaeon]
MLSRKIFRYLSLKKGAAPGPGKQLERLMEACGEADFYRDRWGKDPADVDTLEELSALPTVDRQDILSNLDDLRTVSPGDADEVKTTSGSTGEPLEVLFNEKAHDMLEAEYLRALRHAGYRLRDRVAYYWFEDFEDRFYDSYIMRKERVATDLGLEEQADRLRDIDPDALYYYPSMLFSLAKHLEGEPDVPEPDYILTHGEVLTNGMRETIEKVFDAPVFDRYATAEFGVVAFQCEEGSYHRCIDSFWFDFEDTRQGREIIVTDLRNTATPMVRYRTGDIAGEETGCGCGLSLPAFEGIRGRRENFVETGKRTVSPVEVIESLEDLHELLYFRVEFAGESIRLCFVPGDSFSEEVLEKAESNLRQLLGDIELEFQELERVEPGARGKLPMVEKNG